MNVAIKCGELELALDVFRQLLVSFLQLASTQREGTEKLHAVREVASDMQNHVCMQRKYHCQTMLVQSSASAEAVVSAAISAWWSISNSGRCLIWQQAV